MFHVALTLVYFQTLIVELLALSIMMQMAKRATPTVIPIVAITVVFWCSRRPTGIAYVKSSLGRFLAVS